MRDLALLLIHLFATLVKLLGRGGARSVVAESVLLKRHVGPENSCSLGKIVVMKPLDGRNFGSSCG
jgi:hypothetical protein